MNTRTARPFVSRVPVVVATTFGRVHAILLRAGVVAVALAAAVSGVSQDFGDQSSATLTKKAWEALAAGDEKLVLAYTGKCRELYAAEARTQQASLTAFAPADKAHDFWALNDVGTCLFIEGQLFEKQQLPKEAATVYRELADDLKFCQCWDEKGWFWKPAEAAAGRLKELEFDASLK
ncbi:MAG: beta-glucanase precursor [Planctomycetaceae bacterium]